MNYFFIILANLLLVGLTTFGQTTSPVDTLSAPGTTQADTAVKPVPIVGLVKIDSVPASATEADDLLAGLTDSTETQPLLPSKMLFTQRAFWGPKGLLRVLNVAPLTAEGRSKELNVRRTMLIMHQIGGFVTLVGFVAQGLLGAKLYNAQGEEYVN